MGSWVTISKLNSRLRWKIWYIQFGILAGMWRFSQVSDVVSRLKIVPAPLMGQPHMSGATQHTGKHEWEVMIGQHFALVQGQYAISLGDCNHTSPKRWQLSWMANGDHFCIVIIITVIYTHQRGDPSTNWSRHWIYWSIKTKNKPNRRSNGQTEILVKILGRGVSRHVSLYSKYCCFPCWGI